MKYIIIISTILTSCVIFPPLTSNSFEEIKKVDIGLFTIENDTLLKNSVDNYKNLQGTKCKQLRLVTKLDPSNRQGISFRLFRDIVSPKDSSFYGPYPMAGLLSKIKDIQISFSNQSDTLIVNNYLVGDSTIKLFLWSGGNYINHHQTPFGWYSIKGGHKVLYFKNLEDFLLKINTKPKLFEGITNYDFLFNFKQHPISFLRFNPNSLNITLSLQDSLKNNKIFKDSFKINSL